MLQYKGGKGMLKKVLVLIIIGLFFGISIIPAMNSNSIKDGLETSSPDGSIIQSGAKKSMNSLFDERMWDIVCEWVVDCGNHGPWVQYYDFGQEVFYYSEDFPVSTGDTLYSKWKFVDTGQYRYQSPNYVVGPGYPGCYYPSWIPDLEGAWRCELYINGGYEDYETFWVVGGGNQAPVADAGGPYSGAPGELITFDGSGSYDPDGTITGYRWDWTNDGSWDTGWSSSPTATHSYPSEGTYTVALEVKDNEDATDTDTAHVSITAGNLPPVADAGGPYSGAPGELITFDGSGSYDPDGTITGYRWDWTNDGNWDTSWSSSPTTTHSYGSKGSYTVKLEVKDNNDLTDTDTTSVTISNSGNHPPEKPVITDGENVCYTEENYMYFALSKDPESDQIKYGWDWNGDGTVDDWTGFFNSGDLSFASTSWSDINWEITDKINIKVKAKDDKGLESDWSNPYTIDINALKSAIIICGGKGPSDDNTKVFESDANRAYNTFIGLGYYDHDIKYLSNKHYFKNGVDESCTKDNIKNSITNWLKNRCGSDSNYFIYLTDHGNKNSGEITINDGKEYLFPTNLQTYLNKVENYNIGTIVIDACYSGKNIEWISNPKRIIMTSTDSETTSLSSRFSSESMFSKNIFETLEKGKSYGEAWEVADEKVDSWRWGFWLTKFLSIFGIVTDPSLQNPLIDDDGTLPGHGTSDPDKLPIDGDGNLALNTYP